MAEEMGNNRLLDFDAPVLSVRRYSAPETKKKVDEMQRRSSLPFYKPELKSGPVTKPGIVPFLWEQCPGRPKPGPVAVSVRTRPKPPPGRHVAAPAAAETTLPEPQLELGSISAPPTDAPETQKKIETSGTVELLVAKETIEEKRKEEIEEDAEEEKFTDAAETLSRADSFYMNCSVSGLSDGCSDDGGGGGAQLGSKADSPSRDFVMGRFLHAAQAIASSPQCGSRKPLPPRAALLCYDLLRPPDASKIGIRCRPGRPTTPNYQQCVSAITQYYDYEQEGSESSGIDEDEYDDDGTNGNLSSKVCGLLPRFCLKGSLLLNSVPGMKPRSRRPPLHPPTRSRLGSLQIKSSSSDSLSQLEDEYSWEAICRHKLGPVDEAESVENEINISNESKQTENLMEFQNGSSSSYSSPGWISPYRNETPQSPFYKGKAFLGIPIRKGRSSSDSAPDLQEKDDESNFGVSPHDVGPKGSRSTSPAIDRTIYIDCVCAPETPNSKSCSLGIIGDIQGQMDSTEKNSEGSEESRRIEEDSHIVDHRSQVRFEELDTEFCKDSKDCRLNAHETEKNGTHPSNIIVPPPLPKSPTESWLSRTLPSLSSNYRAQQSFYTNQMQTISKAMKESPTNLKMGSGSKPPKAQNRRLRFADVLTTL